MLTDQERNELIATKNGRAVRAALFEIAGFAGVLAAVAALEPGPLVVASAAGILAISMFFRSYDEWGRLKGIEELLQRHADKRRGV